MNSIDPHATPAKSAGYAGENARHEMSDFNWTKAFWLLIFSALLLVVFTLTTLFWFRGAKDRELARKQIYGADASQLHILQAKENAILSQYQWMDKEKGVVRIPIERAMALTVAENEPKGGMEYRPTADAYLEGAAFSRDSLVKTGMRPDTVTSGPSKL